MALAKLEMDPSPHRHPGHDPCANLLPPLHNDNVYEIFLRVPAKDLCRLRVVSHSWWYFLSDPQFIAKYAARHPGPLIVAGYNTFNQQHRILYDIRDLSGCIVKRVLATREEWVLYGQPNLLCVVDWTNMSIKLLNPATGVAYMLPKEFAEEHASYRQYIYKFSFTATFGQVASTGVYKVIRVICFLDDIGYFGQLYEVFTLDDNSHARWRAKKAPPYQIELDHWDNVVINGIIYFLTYNVDEEEHRIGSFNLETEEWSLSIPGPLSTLMDAAADDIDYSFQLTIGALSGTLVIAYHPDTGTDSSIDLWFLADFEKGLWVRQYSIELSSVHPAYAVHPFSVLNDGRIVFVIDTNSGGVLSIYNPETKTSEDVMDTGYDVALGLYTGSALSVANKVPVKVSILFSMLINYTMFVYVWSNLLPSYVLFYRTQMNLHYCWTMKHKVCDYASFCI
jgi:F-box interacting protein